MSNESNMPKRKRRWLRFSLRAFLIFVTVLCVWFAWYLYRAERQKKAVTWVLENGGTVAYDYQLQPNVDVRQPDPNWLSKMIGVDYVHRVESVENLNKELSDVKPLAPLTNLKVLDLYRSQISDLSPLIGMTKLEVLNLDEASVGDLKPLSNLTRLRRLDLSHTKVSDVTPLAGLANLEWLDLGSTLVSDLRPLASLKSLEVLYIDGTQASDLSPLANLKNLNLLLVDFTNTTKKEIQKLQHALPNCTIHSN